MLFSGATVEVIALVGERLARKTNRPLTTAAIIRSTAPMIANFRAVGLSVGSEVAAAALLVPAACLNFSGTSGLPSSSV